MAVLCTFQVVLRYVFDGAIWWAQEVAQFAMIIAYFFGIAYVYKANQEIVIQYVVQRLAPARQHALYIAIQLLVAAFCAMVAIQGLLLAPQQLNFKTYILNIPKFYSTLPLILASISMTVTALYFAACTWRRHHEAAAWPIERLEAEFTVLRETQENA
ncbi:MAG: TRAP transporter small permease [Planctomycetota bacterium]|nr:TRAP transporter small permease [Planctomycetota bacterium]